MNKIKSFRIVYNKEVERKLSTHLNKVCFNGHDSNIKYIKVIVFGTTLEALGISNINPVYIYNLYLYATKEDLDEDTGRVGLRAKNLIKKYVKEPLEPYIPDIVRPNDFIISDNFRADTEYTGHWVDIDMNSAEPYYVTKVLPELEAPIKRLYAQRSKKPINKQILNAINGNLRNMYASKYLTVVNTLFEKMGWLWDELIKWGIIPFALRRDGILALLPHKKAILPITIPISKDLGDFKVTYDYGTIKTTQSDYNYLTDMKKIRSKTQGVYKKRYLDRLSIVCYGNTGLVINKKGGKINGKK